MDKDKKHFYVAKGKNENSTWLLYGNKPTINNGRVNWDNDTYLVGSFTDNPIADSMEDNTIVKIYIRKETIKKK